VHFPSLIDTFDTLKVIEVFPDGQSILSLMLLPNADEITATIHEVIVRDEVRHANSRKWILACGDLVMLKYLNDAVDYRLSIAPNSQVGA